MPMTHGPKGPCCSNRAKRALLAPLAHGPIQWAHAVALVVSAVVLANLVIKVKSGKVQSCKVIVEHCRDLCDKERPTFKASQMQVHATKKSVRQRWCALGPARFKHEVQSCKVFLERGTVGMFCKDVGRVEGA